MKLITRKEYISPETEILETGLGYDILVGSDWNDGSLDDTFDIRYDL